MQAMPGRCHCSGSPSHVTAAGARRQQCWASAARRRSPRARARRRLRRTPVGGLPLGAGHGRCWGWARAGGWVHRGRAPGAAAQQGLRAGHQAAAAVCCPAAAAAPQCGRSGPGCQAEHLLRPAPQTAGASPRGPGAPRCWRVPPPWARRTRSRRRPPRKQAPGPQPQQQQQQQAPARHPHRRPCGRARGPLLPRRRPWHSSSSSRQRRCRQQRWCRSSSRRSSSRRAAPRPSTPSCSRCRARPRP
jgi:hypothetical protein